MNFKQVNNIVGWIVFAIAYITYLLTMEATASLWDCGEFLATAYKLEVTHSPGAPLFMMLGRLFGMAAPLEKVALWINSMSALMSGFTILFLFWTITHFAKKILVKKDEEVTGGNLIATIGAGVVGALAYAFSDTFWFSAVEAEVYASSSFFTAIVFWAVLKWEHSADQPHADRWLILIFYLMGLSIGVHLLNLLTIPAIVMVYYFRRYNVTLKGSIIAFLIGCGVLAFVQFGIIQYVPIFASWFELLFVNSFGLPLNTGAIFFLILFVALMTWLIIWAKKTGRYLVHLGTLSVAFVMIGYSSYIGLIVRSKADVPIDMGNPDNVMTLIPFLQRDQYGSMPLFSGPDFTSRVTAVDNGRPTYAAVTKDGKTRYELVDHKPVYKFDHTRIFPRIHDFNDPNHVSFYRAYLGLSDVDEPTAMDNQKFFWGYQVNWMYWRYLMWNYVGRQNDMQGQSEAHYGNWLSGIKFIDKMFGRGDVDLMSEGFRNNKARNELYFLPFILGILGLVYQFNRDKNDGTIVGLLFFFTGLAIVIYLNNTPQQPRERDYAYAGSTYAFAIWIGLGVLMVTDWLRKLMKGSTPALAATLICILAVPVLMVAKEWDDHDRSKKTIARDHAYNMLSTCDSNAILITYGDNDTYPLWYLQEIEGVRPDIRIINHNLLGTDWQNEQLNYKINKADALPTIWKPDQYRGKNLNYIMYYQDPKISKDRFFSLEEIIQFSTSEKFRAPTSGGEMMNYLPTKNFALKVNRDEIIKAGLAKAADSASIPEEIRWIYNKPSATRADLSLMNIIAGQAKTGWKRPIYLTPGAPNLGLDAYLQSEGCLLKLVPMNKQQTVQGMAPYTDLDKNLNLMTKTFRFGDANKKSVYYDEKNRLIFLVYRQNAAQLAIALSAADRKEDAVKVLDNFAAAVSESSLPLDIYLYDRGLMTFVSAYYAAGAKEKAQKLCDKIHKNIIDEIRYFKSLNDNYQDGTDLVIAQQNLAVLNYMAQTAKQGGDDATAAKFEKSLQTIAQGIPAPR